MSTAAPHRGTAGTARSLLLAVLAVTAVVLIACTPPDSGGGTPGGVTTTLPGTTTTTAPGGSTTTTTTPPGGGTASTVTAGRQHSCVRKANATVACWGNNSFGQLGNGATDDQNAPVSVRLVP